MLRRHPWRTFLGTASLVGSSAYIYHCVTRPSRTPEARERFDVRVPAVGPDGKRTYSTQSLPLLPMSDINARLKEHATLRAVTRPGNIIWKHATAQLASNSPIEDAHAEAIIERDQQDGDYLLFAVMDGHAGPHTSRLLAKTLIPSVALQLRELSSSPASFDTQPNGTSYLGSIRSLFWSTSKTSAGRAATPYDADPKFVALAIQTAFAMADSEIVNAPLRILYDHLKEIGAKGEDVLPDLSNHPMALASMDPALSGSCAILTLFDTAHRDLYVACTGDCRAVAGVWEESSGVDGSGNGAWRVDVLSADQTGRNPNELKRLQGEHPKDESSTVVQRGRILGGLEPSRAFGDARYKWPLYAQQILSRVYLEGNDKPMRRPPPDFRTPPYVTAQPVISYRKLDFLPLDQHAPLPFPSPLGLPPTPSAGGSSSSSKILSSIPFLRSDRPATASGSNASAGAGIAPSPTTSRASMRFLILATDGLWDQISSGDAVALVGAHLSGLRAASVSRSSLRTYAPTRIGDSPGVEGKGDKSPSLSSSSSSQNQNQGQGNATDGGPAWSFIDPHPGVHLLRNAFGGADADRVRRLLSIPAPYSRRYRDDVTVTVVWWEDGRLGDPKSESVTLRAGNGGGEDRIKAKL